MSSVCNNSNGISSNQYSAIFSGLITKKDNSEEFNESLMLLLSADLISLNTPVNNQLSINPTTSTDMNYQLSINPPNTHMDYQSCNKLKEKDNQCCGCIIS